MCGIAGMISRRVHDPATVARAMADDQTHRGPDADGSASFEAGAWRGALSHRRLAIIDLSAAGVQPMSYSEAGITVTYNGEIYNFTEIRRDLISLGHVFHTHTDTEVLLHAYAEWKERCLDHLVGMFAFAIWDENARALFLARDRFGIKPLYYYAAPETFLFASEVGALLASGLIPRELDTAAVDAFLQRGWVPSPLTMVQGIRLLPAGHCAWWKDGQLTLREYWHLADYAYPHGPAASPDDLHERLRSAVRSELVSDVPLGAFLSGGIDSSTIVALMAEQEGMETHSVSLVFDEQKYNEAPYSRMVAGRFHTVHHEIPTSGDGVLAMLPTIWQAMDQPSVDGVNSYIVSQAARRAGLTVALSGLGADELFCGYGQFGMVARWYRFREVLRHVPRPVRTVWANALDRLTRGRYAKALRILRDAPDAPALHGIHREVFSEEARQRLLRDTPRESPEREETDRRLAERVRGLDPVTAFSVLEASTYMRDMLLRDTDVMSMAHSLEVRVPFLNHPLAEAVIALAPEHKLSPDLPKPLLLRALGDRLPREVIQRPKMGFELPFNVWMRSTLRETVEDLLLSPRTCERGVFAPETVRWMWNAFCEGRPGLSWSRPWALAVFEHWCRQFLDASRPSAEPALALRPSQAARPAGAAEAEAVL